MKDWEYDQKEIENESCMTSIYGHLYRKYKWHGSKTNYDMNVLYISENVNNVNREHREI